MSQLISYPLIPKREFNIIFIHNCWQACATKIHCRGQEKNNYSQQYIFARENEVRERIPHTCPSSYEIFFQSIFVSASCGVAILMSTCYWSVRVTSFNFKLCGGLSRKSSERRLFKKSRSFSRVLIANEPRYISKLEK